MGVLSTRQITDAQVGYTTGTGLEHAYATCERTSKLWDMVIARWNDATGERVDAGDLRVALLGDRGDQAIALTVLECSSERQCSFALILNT